LAVRWTQAKEPTRLATFEFRIITRLNLPTVATDTSEFVTEAPTPTAPSSTVDHELPITVIEPRRGWQIVDHAELWRHRELLYFLTWRDVKVRYKQTVLGAAWAVLQPAAMMFVFSLFFGRVAQAPSGGMPYPVFVLCGLLPWYFFANSISSAAQSIVANQNLVTKVYFPRLMIPMSAVAAGLVDFLIGLGLLVPMMLYYQVAPTLQLLLLPPLIVGLALLAVGVGTLLSALTVAYRDFRHVVPFMVQLWMFATPAVYLNATDAFGPRWNALLPLNPAYGLIANFRAAALGTPLDWSALAISMTVVVTVLFVGLVYFRRVERGFADII
jgi:lipopolysaccharide transport system permease protein